jgi:very-short-patch-repair endonuclease
MATFRPCPKNPDWKRKKPPKPIARTPIKKRKGSAKCSDNGKRVARRDPAEVQAWAAQKRGEKLADLSPAQLAIGEVLRDYGVKFEFEWIWENGDFPYFSDIFIPSIKMTIEADGDFHKDQKKADTGKAMYIARNYGVGTIRIPNKDCLDDAKARKRIAEMLGMATEPSSASPLRSPRNANR